MIRRALGSNVTAMNTHIHFDIGSSSLGRVLVAITDKGLCAILLGDSPQAVTRELRERFPAARLTPDAARVAPALRQVIDLVAGRRSALDLPLDPAGTEFQQRVWRAIAQVPAGETTSYGEIAKRLGCPKAVRAVGAAIGRNPLIVVVPCHRIVGAGGALTGYAGGLDRKRALLTLEGRA